MEFDFGGIASLIFTLGALVTFFYLKGKRPKDIKSFINELDVSSAILTIVTIIAYWLTVRIAGLYVVHYLTVEGYHYTQYEIFDIVAYALAASLCVTLTKSVKNGKGEIYERRTELILNATLQAILIGILIFLPRWNDPFVFPVIQAHGYVFILLGMALSLLLIVIAKERARKGAKAPYTS